MAKYKKKPVVIEAVQWHGFEKGPHDLGIVPAQMTTTNEAGALHLDLGQIDTLEGPHQVSPGDWIITGIKGERYPCKPDIFAATYDWHSE